MIISAIKMNYGDGVVFDTDQGTPGTVQVEFFCNAAGTAWEVDGVPPRIIVITRTECAYS